MYQLPFDYEGLGLSQQITLLQLILYFTWYQCCCAHNIVSYVQIRWIAVEGFAHFLVCNKLSEVEFQHHEIDCLGLSIQYHAIAFVDIGSEHVARKPLYW